MFKIKQKNSILCYLHFYDLLKTKKQRMNFQFPSNLGGHTEPIIVHILSFLTKKECLEKFIVLSKYCNEFTGKIQSRIFYSEDYIDICKKNCGCKMLMKLAKNKRCIFDLKSTNKNIAKYIIRKNYKIVFVELEICRPSFNWNRNFCELLRYSIFKLKPDMVSFLFQKVKNAPSVNVTTKIMNEALSTRNDSMILDVSKHLGINLAAKFLSFRTMIIERRYKDAVDRIFSGNEKIQEKYIEEILDVLVQRDELVMIQFILENYEGEFIGETGLLRAMKIKKKEITKTLLSTNKLDVAVMNNKAMILAAENGWLEVLKILIKQGGDPSTQENSPIVIASRNGNYKVVEFLMNQKAVDPSDLDNYAYDEAKRSGFKEIENLLYTHSKVKEVEIKKKYSHVLYS